MIEIQDNEERLLDKIDKNNERAYEGHIKTAGDMAECLAEDLFKPFQQVAEGKDKYEPALGWGKEYARGYEQIDWSSH